MFFTSRATLIREELPFRQTVQLSAVYNLINLRFQKYAKADRFALNWDQGLSSATADLITVTCVWPQKHNPLHFQLLSLVLFGSPRLQRRCQNRHSMRVIRVTHCWLQSSSLVFYFYSCQVPHSIHLSAWKIGTCQQGWRSPMRFMTSFWNSVKDW